MGITEIMWLLACVLVGMGLSVLDAQWGLHTALLEAVHALVLSALLVGCVVAHNTYPQIRRFGWPQILLGVTLLTLGAWVDILDQYDVVILGIPFGHTWQQAFIEKILGYSAGIGLIGVGFWQWLPWMVKTRHDVEALNAKLTETLTTVDERVEAERMMISRELHDDVAQRLTALGFSVQLVEATVAEAPKQGLEKVRRELSDCLKTVRQVCRNLRPDALEVLGVIPALESYLTTCREQHPAISFSITLSNHETVSQAIQQGLSLDGQLHLYRLLQESIRNAIKHSCGNRVEVMVDVTPDNQLNIAVVDNGKGLPWPADDVPTSQALVEAGHLGVAGLRERATELGGEYRLQAGPNNIGTQAAVVVPLTPQAITDLPATV